MPQVPWYVLTRTIGAAILLYGVFGDQTPERGTIIMTGAGFMGFDSVLNSGGKPGNKQESRPEGKDDTSSG